MRASFGRHSPFVVTTVILLGIWCLIPAYYTFFVKENMAADSWALGDCSFLGHGGYSKLSRFLCGSAFGFASRIRRFTAFIDKFLMPCLGIFDFGRTLEAVY